MEPDADGHRGEGLGGRAVEIDSAGVPAALSKANESRPHLLNQFLTAIIFNKSDVRRLAWKREWVVCVYLLLWSL